MESVRAVRVLVDGVTPYPSPISTADETNSDGAEHDRNVACGAPVDRAAWAAEVLRDVWRDLSPTQVGQAVP